MRPDPDAAVRDAAEIGQLIALEHRLQPLGAESVDAEEEDLVGEFAHTDAGYEIRVAPGLCRRERSLVLLHELLHAVSDLGGSPLSERQVLALENGLGAFAVDHPDVWKEFSKA